MQFSDFGLSEPILRAVGAEGYSTPTPIQTQAIAPVMAGRDLIGLAQTGTGKTAAFALPILHRLAQTPRSREPRCLVLAPTRELAAQVAESFKTYGCNLHLKTAVVFGGVGFGQQMHTLRAGVDVLVACPGRLLDLINQGVARLSQVQILVLDEADRMLDMGFLPDIRKVVGHCQNRRQTLLFSATMPREIRDLASFLLKNPVEVAVAPVSSAAETVDQSVFLVQKPLKLTLLTHLLSQSEVERALVFTRTKHGADKVVRKLGQSGLRAAAIHGNKSQGQRERALDDFRQGRIQVLVASDIAARGLDVDGITHVINFEIPNEPETYVHRIGRTGRAGASGIAISLCDHEEKTYLADIERLLRRRVEIRHWPEGLPRPSAEESAPPAAMPPPARRGQPQRHQAPARPVAPQRSGHSQPGQRHVRFRPQRPERRSSW